MREADIFVWPLPAAIAVPLLIVGVLRAQPAGDLIVPWGPRTFIAEEGCRWEWSAGKMPELPRNEHYIAPPAAGRSWDAWLAQIGQYREHVRARHGDPRLAQIVVRFDGVRAWVRTDRAWAFAADLAPKESLVLAGEARCQEGNNRLCLAFDWCDRREGVVGKWRGWSTVVGSAPVAPDGKWHEFKIAVAVPPFDRDAFWARPILGMDGTFDPKPGAMAVRNVRAVVPAAPDRSERWKKLESQVPDRFGFDDSIYRRHDLKWMARNFVCGFLFVYDRAVYDPEQGQYRVGPLCDEARREFGGYDSVVLWHAYPRIGADGRNQFDFFRDMPGGLEGLRSAVREFHQRKVKVFIPYNPWDTGTDRPKEADESALARVTAAIEADGIFLDTMLQAPPGLRPAVDALRPGVAFEPEGHPSIDELQRCSGSWAQWLRPFPGIGALHLKWIEPRHLQHQIRRWDSSHQEELAAAWLNGSGILVWENIFGFWNPWNAVDRADLRRMAPVLRHYAALFTEGQWLPCFPTQAAKVHASCWKSPQVRLWTLVNQSGRTVESPVLEVEDQGERFFDLWRGAEIRPQRNGAKTRLAVPIDRFGAVAAVRPDAVSPALLALVNGQRQEASRPVASGSDDPHVAAQSVVEPKAPPNCAAAESDRAGGMLRVKGASRTFVVRHQRRECGCYPDPGTPPQEWHRFLTGNPFSQTMEHRVAATLADYRIDAQPVTNGQFQAFLAASGYQPRSADNFLRHWGGRRSPPEIADQPVVYVDLDDARAYAAWAKRRLPTEWEWHHAAEQLGESFARSEVYEWTESQRDDGHVRFVMLRGGSRYQAQGSIWYFPGGPQPIQSHAKFLLLYPGLDRCSTIGFRCVVPHPGK